MDASRALQRDEDWYQFYAYLTSPRGAFDSTKARVKTLGDLEELPKIEPYPPGYTVETHRNGPEEIITIVNHTPCEDDEKRQED